MKAEIKTIDGYEQLVITIPMQPPTLSSTGKSLVVVSSAGGKATTAQVNGKPVTVNVTGWIKPQYGIPPIGGILI